MCFWALWATFGARYRLMGCRWKRLGQAKLDLQFLTIFATRGGHKIEKNYLKLLKFKRKIWIGDRPFLRPSFLRTKKGCTKFGSKHRQTIPFKPWGGFIHPLVVQKEFWANYCKVRRFFSYFCNKLLVSDTANSIFWPLFWLQRLSLKW